MLRYIFIIAISWKRQNQQQQEYHANKNKCAFALLRSALLGSVHAVYSFRAFIYASTLYMYLCIHLTAIVIVTLVPFLDFLIRFELCTAHKSRMPKCFIPFYACATASVHCTLCLVWYTPSSCWRSVALPSALLFTSYSVFSFCFFAFHFVLIRSFHTSLAKIAALSY